MLLHELVHIYLGPVSFSNEVYGVNEVIALEKGRKETNAANYVFFVGSRFGFLYTLAFFSSVGAYADGWLCSL